MLDKSYLIFPLTSAVLYAFGALALKSAERQGAGVVQITILANLALAAVFAGFYPWGEFPVLPALWWPVVAVGVSLVVGQVASILAFTRGEVSVATPALGTKVVFVAMIASAFTARPVTLQTWFAALAMLAGLWLLVGRPAKAESRHVVAALVFSLLGALAFASFDVVVQVWSPVLRFGVLLPLGVALGSLLSLPLLLLVPHGGPGWQFRKPALRPLVAGIVLVTLQSLILIWSIGKFGDAAGANVVYASRGIWSVLLVQLMSGWFAHVEQFRSRAVFIRRAAGATVMVLGVFLAFA